MRKIAFTSLVAALFLSAPAMAQMTCSPSFDGGAGSANLQMARQIAQASPAATPFGVPVASKPAGAAQSTIPPVVARMQAQGYEVGHIGTEDGMEFWYFRKGEQFMFGHVTPSGRSFVAGVMFAEDGKNVTRRLAQQAKVQMDEAPAGLESALLEAESMPAIEIGNGPIKVNMMIDANCGFSRMGVLALKPLADRNVITLRLIVAAILNESSMFKGATLLKGGKPAVENWLAGGRIDETKDDNATLRNVALGTLLVGEKTRFGATPSLLWREDGGVQGSKGVPADFTAKLEAMARSR